MWTILLYFMLLMLLWVFLLCVCVHNVCSSILGCREFIIWTMSAGPLYSLAAFGVEIIILSKDYRI